MAVFSLLTAQERSSEPTQVVRPPWAFVRGWNNLWQISSFSNRRRKRLQVSRSYGTPLKTPNMLEGDVPQEQMIKHIKIGCYFLFVKKVSENWGTLWGWSKRTQTQYMVAVGKEELIWAGHLRHKQDSKELEFLVWHVWAGLEWDTAPRANPAHSGRSTYRTRGKVTVSSSHEREYCTTKRDVTQWQACTEWDEVSSELA